MYRMLQTIIGSGNSYEDVSFLWFPDYNRRLANSDTGTLKSIAAQVGFGVDRVLPSSESETQVQAALADALISRTPKPIASEVLRFVVDLSRTFDTPESRKEFATSFSRWLSEGHSLTLTELQRQERLQLDTYDPKRLHKNIVLAFAGPSIVVERSPPAAEAIMSLLSKGSGAAMGAYLGFQAAANSPIYLFAAVPGGILICCTAVGIAEALQFGLRERIFSWLSGQPSERRETGAVKSFQQLISGTSATREIEEKGGQVSSVGGSVRRTEN